MSIRRGFASMPKEQRQAIQRAGALAQHRLGKARLFTSATANAHYTKMCATMLAKYGPHWRGILGMMGAKARKDKHDS
jgi:hypothetical protein